MENKVGGWAATATRAQAQAQRLRPFGVGLFILVVVGIAVGDVLQPVLRAVRDVEPGSPRSIWPAFQWASLQLLKVAPSIALAYAVWYGQHYLDRLSRGEVWNMATPQLLRRVGACLIWAGALADLIVPTALQWFQAQGGFNLQLNTLNLVLAALGALLLLISRVLWDVLETAQNLKTETDGFV